LPVTATKGTMIREELYPATILECFCSFALPMDLVGRDWVGEAGDSSTFIIKSEKFYCCNKFSKQATKPETDSTKLLLTDAGSILFVIE
jgi:hypothetical protein